MSTPASENPPSDLASPVMVENIGKRVNVFQYAVQEWQGNTKKAKTILQVLHFYFYINTTLILVNKINLYNYMKET